MLQTGYRAVWWSPTAAGEAFLSAGPIDLLDDRISLRPGETARIAIRPMHPPVWGEVQRESVLHLRERRGQTLGIATVLGRVEVPNHSRLLLEDVVQRVGEVHLTSEVEESERPRLHEF